jgi:hypothetical protein
VVRDWGDHQEGPELAVVVLLLWLGTAVAGFTLLRAGSAARLAAAPAASPAPAPVPVRVGAAPLTAKGVPPPIPHPQVSRAESARTLLEFSHPALAITGIACWMMFTFVHYRPLAWIAFVILVVTGLIGLGWLTSSRRATRKQASGAWSFPPRLAWLHGLVAASSLVLTVLTALIASRS